MRGGSEDDRRREVRGAGQVGSRLWLRSHGSGSIAEPPAGRTSKCRCGPVELPEFPENAIWSPAFTVVPEGTLYVERWQYHVSVPSIAVTIIMLPYALFHCVRTVPSVAAITGVP